MRIKTILATACLLVSSMTMVAQTSSFLGYCVTIDGQDYFAKDITIGEKTVKIINADDTSTSFDISHGSKQTLPMKKALYCVKGTLTTDLVKKVAAENAIWFGTINATDVATMGSNLYGYTSFSLAHLDISGGSVSSMFKNATTLKTVDFSNVGGYYLIADKLFYGCSNLKYIDLSGTTFENAVSSLFEGCTSLTTIRAVGCSKNMIEALQSNITEAGLDGQVTLIIAEE